MKELLGQLDALGIEPAADDDGDDDEDGWEDVDDSGSDVEMT